MNHVVMCCAVMAGLAGAACEGGIKPTATISAPDSADQVLITMSHEVTDSGVRRAKVSADTAYFYSPSQTAELRRVHITFYDPVGVLRDESLAAFQEAFASLGYAACAGEEPEAGFEKVAVFAE